MAEKLCELIKNHESEWKTFSTAQTFDGQQANAFAIPTEFKELAIRVYLSNRVYGKYNFVPQELTDEYTMIRACGYYESTQYRADVVLSIKKGYCYGFIRLEGTIRSDGKADVYYR